MHVRPGGWLRVFGTALILTQAAEPVAAAAVSRPVRIVALGDSTTATALDWAPDIKHVYADCLPGALAAYGIAATVINAGIGDTTTRDAVARLDRDVRAHHPDLVIVQFGINDSWIDVDLGKERPRLTRYQYRQNLTTIARRLRADGALVVLMTPNPMRWRDPNYIKAFGEHPGLLDVHDRAPGHSIDEILLAGDGIHPNEAGQNLVCRLLTPSLARLIGRDRAKTARHSMGWLPEGQSPSARSESFAPCIKGRCSAPGWSCIPSGRRR